MKKCKLCSVSLTVENAVKNKKSKDGLDYKCVSCNRETVKKWRANNPKGYKAWQVQSFYGITLPEAERMLAKQNDCCAICNKSISLETTDVRQNRACIDHNHDTGQVRGLLCDKCNRGLGYFNDNEELLLKAVNYLTKYC